MTSTAYAHHFSERNVPFGIASSQKHPEPRPATRIENTVIFLDKLAEDGLFRDITDLPTETLSEKTLNKFASLPKTAHRGVRQKIQDVFKLKGLDGFPVSAREEIGNVAMHLPVDIGDFAGKLHCPRARSELLQLIVKATDFSCSLEHVKNAGRIIINDARPPPAFFNFPIGYQGRASSIVVSGTEIERPLGQYRNPKAMAPDAQRDEKPIVYGPSLKMDYELEFAAIIGKPLPMRQRLNVKQTDDHIFGFVLMNDWSCESTNPFGDCQRRLTSSQPETYRASK